MKDEDGMRIMLFYVNGEYWKQLEVPAKSIDRHFFEYHVATKTPSAVCSMDEAIDMNLSVTKKVIFRLTAMETFAIYDEEIYLEGDCLYLKEQNQRQPDRKVKTA